MSLSLVQVPLKKVFTPVVNLNTQKNYVIAKGAKDSTYQVFNAQNLNENQITISCNPPSNQIVVNRRAYLNLKFRLTISGIAGAGGLMVQPNLDAPRCYPIARSLNTIQATLNNDQYSAVLNQYWPALAHYHNKRLMETNNYSSSPNMLDQYQEYNDFLNPFFGGNTKNALASYGNSSEPEGNRAGFSGFEIISDVGGVAVVDIDATELIFMSPFNFQEEQESGWIGLNNMSVTLSFANLASAVWSHNATALGASTINNIAVQITKCNVLLNFQTPPMELPLKNEYAYPYYEVTPYSTPAQTINSNTSLSFNFNSVTLKTIPRRIYVFARESLNDLSGTSNIIKTDTFGCIDNLNITFNNKVGLLSTASATDLYNMSVENGLQDSWSQYNKYMGSVVCIEVSKDLSLDDSLASGVLGSFQLGVTALVRNPRKASDGNARNVNYQLWVVVVNEGIMNIVNGSVSHQVGVFNNSQVIDTPIDSALKYKQTRDIYGGLLPAAAIPIISTLAGIAAPILAKGASSLAKKALRYSGPSKVADFMDEVGLGGSLMEGGRMMSRSQMRNRL